MSADRRPSHKWKSTVLGGLVILNALLLAVLIMRHTPDTTARAAAGRPVGDVIAIPGQLSGMSDGVVFLYDPQGQRLGVVAVDSAARNPEVQSVRPLPLDQLLNAPAGVKGK
jgi:hypothetical protein